MRRDTEERTAGGDLADRAVAIWLTLSSLRPFAESVDAAAITKAMGCLDEVAELALVLGAERPVRCLDDMLEIEMIVEEIHGPCAGRARINSVEEQLPWLDDAAEIDAMAEANFAHLQEAEVGRE